MKLLMICGLVMAVSACTGHQTAPCVSASSAASASTKAVAQTPDGPNGECKQARLAGSHDQSCGCLASEQVEPHKRVDQAAI
ncbi:MAG: hypothetical protein ACHQAU_01905 [Gammaproteobacteria bacterium]